MKTPKYHCASCGLAVIVFTDEEPIRACKCESSIIAEMTAEASGTSEIAT